ncbi:5-dehydro-4-deoxy-D-glucuronate isomerase [Aureimonas altamirensis]|uniref:5-dehydro-4-deoxy-D-glucuronate isomerase n=1 Tax=Aureimonas altamirensis TaxID=370622 RepID=UPI0020374972|nr:5-dehydro-4-deoxy-D-glucuronate isomerase [Aureimonas altamirensis]MCM2502388.1 5-dehydro-4-deoxy-D-glucuronate isomerase [Aureimonas altamirensis]
MTLDFTSRNAIDPAAAAAMDTDRLRENFHLGSLFKAGTVSLVYTHYDRMVVGGVVPVGAVLELPPVKPMGTASFLERRELVVVNIGGTGAVDVSGVSYPLGTRDMLYVGLGETVTFSSDDPGRPAKFYILSAPAHRKCPTVRIGIDQAKRLDLGSAETSNERSIFQFTTTIETCQLVAGMTQLAKGSVWNTMPAHVHDRRMEAYLYFDLPEDARIFHFMGEPSQTRHLVMAKEEAVISPPWSIHSGCGTASYAFIWAMAGDNIDYTDVDKVNLGDMR